MQVYCRTYRITLVLLFVLSLGALLGSESWSDVVTKVFEYFLGSGTELSLRNVLVFDPDPPIGLQLIVYSEPVSKVRYPDLVVSLLQSTIAVTPAGSCVNFLQSPYGTCSTFPLWSTIDVSLYGCGLLSLSVMGSVGYVTRLKTIIKQRVKKRSWWAFGIFCVSTLLLLNMLGVFNDLVTPPS